MDGDPSQEDRIRLIGRLFFYTKVTASNHTYMQYSQHDGLVVIGTWWIPSPFCFFSFDFIHRYQDQVFSIVCKAVTSLPCWGRVVIGSLTDYQSVGAGSKPVVSTTVLVSAIRSIGSGQKNCSSFAWEGLEKSRLFLIFSTAYWAFFWHRLSVIVYL